MARRSDDRGDTDEGGILSPDELDISQDEHVAEIDDGRYVVSPSDPIDDVAAVDSGGSGAGTELPPEPASEPEPEPPELTEEAVHEFLATQFDDSGSRYGFDITATFDGATRQRQMVSNDVVTIFESLVLWYAQQIDGRTPVEEVLGIMLMEANVPVRYPPASLQRLLESTDLSPDDSIAELIAAVGDEDGFRL
ncbi:hypothetical protein C475_09869 [Halosimplex carlsbadense 2-9-1]|uniref:Flagella cluster protein n=1 Tax=Halosimplex carlsbadense 2-9-1 TaxID=797114 RepID=M0CTL2_9EURY|nr:hypothetical protein [Halosimplex carlsbadense]ELZ25757.1 hypothetical protein C475_09869 [Halosimplex carlsbadense 2-9-1]